ncbi:MAG: hypothetical protein LBK99_18065 [Opitutaceae bacterium]|nr:hypothetical protein [Opitutaceae bacterium]
MLRRRELERRSPDRCGDAKRRRFERQSGEALRASPERQECRRSGFA